MNVIHLGHNGDVLDWRLADDDGRVDLARWDERVRARISVGRCRCGGPLSGSEADVDAITKVVHLPVGCVACGAETAWPAKRPLRVLAAV